MTIRRHTSKKTKSKRSTKKTTKRVTSNRIPKKTMREMEDFFIRLNKHLEYRETDPDRSFTNDNGTWIEGEVQMVYELSKHFNVVMWEGQTKKYRKNQKISYTRKQVETYLNKRYDKVLETEDTEFKNEKKAQSKGEGYFQLRKKWVTGRITVLRQTANFFDINLKEHK